MCRVIYQSSTIIRFAAGTTKRHVIAVNVQIIKVLTILPFSPADRKGVHLDSAYDADRKEVHLNAQ
jgi:hypothetical protein